MKVSEDYTQDPGPVIECKYLVIQIADVKYRLQEKEDGSMVVYKAIFGAESYQLHIEPLSSNVIRIK